MSYNPDNIKKVMLIGVSGENLSAKLEFDMTNWAEKWSNAGYAIALLRPDELTPYNVDTTYDANTKILTWIISSIDTAIVGDGKAQIIAIEDNIVKKSFIFDVEIKPSLTPTGEVPDPLEDWYQRMIQVELETKGYRDEAQGYSQDAENAKIVAVNAKEAAEDARDLALQYKQNAQQSANNAALSETNAHNSEVNAQGYANAASQSANDAAASAREIEDLTVSAHQLPEGSSPTATKTKPEGQPYNIDFGIPKGDKGDKGDDGDVSFATFEIDINTGELKMITPDNYQSDVIFNINSNGYLEVIIN